MESDDIVYICLLIFTIVFGHYYRQIESYNGKKVVSTAVGFIIVLFVSGIHIVHPITLVAVNAFIILCTSKRTCHVTSFFFSFFYLLFFRTTIYFNIPYPPGHTNLVQMMFTLKLVGLAFEVHDSSVLEEKELLLEPHLRTRGRVYLKPTLRDIIDYSFCYIGVLTGPYYTFKTYQDYYETQFYKVADCWGATKSKLVAVPLYAVIFLLLTYYFPLKYMDTDEFNNSTTLLYRLLYMNAVFTIFRMRIYIGLVLSECACTMAGLGAYPASTTPRPGLGPFTHPEEIQKLVADPTISAEYNFETIHNINPLSAEFDLSFRNTIKNWNMCIQYWLAFVIYKRFPSKALRTAAVFAVSAFWHGVYIGYYFCLCAPPFYLPIEDIWEKILQREEMKKGNILKRKIVNFLFWFIRTEAFAFMGVAFCLLHTEKVLRFYRSIYYVFHIGCAVALVVGLAILKLMPRKRANAESTKKAEKVN